MDKPIDPRDAEGPCDYTYAIGERKGTVCGRLGWKDGSGCRCSAHRLSVVKSWSRTAARQIKTFRNRFSKMFARLPHSEQCIREVQRAIIDLAVSLTGKA